MIDDERTSPTLSWLDIVSLANIKPAISPRFKEILSLLNNTNIIMHIWLLCSTTSTSGRIITVFVFILHHLSHSLLRFTDSMTDRET